MTSFQRGYAWVFWRWTSYFAHGRFSTALYRKSAMNAPVGDFARENADSSVGDKQISDKTLKQPVYRHGRLSKAGPV